MIEQREHQRPVTVGHALERASPLSRRRCQGILPGRQQQEELLSRERIADGPEHALHERIRSGRLQIRLG
ncbi:hypothetical protein RZS08_04925, partial [Arthrospira platensis SPKY1]|nr:hypothetical protein [Arthrospira platensis SPKY1]